MTLNQRITIQHRTMGKDALGQESETWTDVCTVWAEMEPLTGRTLFAAQQANSLVTVRGRIRYRPDVLAGMRALWRGQPHGIEAALDEKGSRQWLQLMCTAGVGDGR